MRHRWERKGEDEGGRGRGAGRHCPKACFPEGSGFSREERAQGGIPLAIWTPRWPTRPWLFCVSKPEFCNIYTFGVLFFKVSKEKLFAKIPAQLS